MKTGPPLGWRVASMRSIPRVCSWLASITTAPASTPDTAVDETTATTDTGSEAWSEEAVHADDVITETEAGPLEESDFETTTEEAAGTDEVTDEASDGETAADEDGDTAEKKG